MGQKTRQRAALFFLFVFSMAAAACTLLLDRSGTQCSTNGDCLHFAENAICVSGVCQPNATDGASADAPPSADGGDAAVLGPPGCSTGTPATNLDFYNACTLASFERFDNCARIGLCGDAGEAPLVAPPVADAAATVPVDGGPASGCYALGQPNVIYMQGSTNFTPFIQAMAPIVAKNGYKIVWQPTSSCAGAGVGFSVAPGDELKNPTTTATSFAAVYDSDGGATPCALGDNPSSAYPGVGETTDVGESDIYGETCNASWTLNANPSVGHYTGPIQPMAFVTPPSSTQRSISAEAARLVFGAGGNDGGVAPWSDPGFMFIRSSTTGTNNILSLGMGVPAKQWWGIDKKTAANMQAAIIGVDPSSSEKTIGVLSMDYADKAKQNLHILYFQARGQLAGFLPDLTPFSYDKQNVRDGHYPLWGPIHLYTKTNAGQPSPAAQAFINNFSVPKPDQSLLDATIGTGNVPVCAMKVDRSTEMGPLSPSVPAFGCGCYFEFKVNGGTSCQACKGPADCPQSRPACNIGYCEIQ